MKHIEEKTIIPTEYDEENNFGFIYITEDIMNNKYYIGKCKFKATKSWKTYLGSGLYLKRAINKYGKENFVKHIIKLCKTEEETLESELFFLNKYKASTNELFYNITNTNQGGYTIEGYTQKDKMKYKENMSKIMKEKAKDKDYLRKVSEGVKRAYKINGLGKKISRGNIERYKKPEERLKTSISSKTRWQSEEYRKRYSENNRMNIYALDDRGNIVKRFKGVKEVLLFLNLKNHTTLLKHTKQGTKYKGYYWKRDKESVETIERISREKNYRE